MNKIIFESKTDYSEWIEYMNQTHHSLTWKFLGGNPNEFPLMVVYNLDYGYGPHLENGVFHKGNDKIEFCIVNENFKK